MNRKTLLKLNASGLLAAGILAMLAPNANAITWTGASIDSPFWSDTNNWDLLLAPRPTDIVNFANQGSTNLLGAVNNVVTDDTSISSISYLSKVSLITSAANYQTTLINPGMTLTVDRGTAGGGLLYVGSTTDEATNPDNQYYYTVKGPGGSLILGNVSTPMTNQGVQVTATQRAFPNHVGSLDLSELDNFSSGGGYFWVGINGGENTAITDRPAGNVRLAKTNLIVIAGTAYDTLNLGSFRVGESRGNTPLQGSWLELGQENTFRTPWLKIGGSRTGGSTNSAGRMFFRPGLTQPKLTLRGTDGVSRLGNVRIADNSYSTSASSIGASGIVDLTGSTVDAFIDTMYVGQGPGGNDTVANGRLAGANGILTWTDGTFDVSTLLLGYQFGNNLSTNSGTLNVLGPNAKLIAGRLVIGRDAGANAGGGVGVLNIDGGTVEIITYLAKGLSGPNVSGTITLTNDGVLNLQSAAAPNPTVAFFDTLNFSSGTVTNGTLALTNLNVFSPATAFTVYPTTVLDPNNVGATGILAVNGGLALEGGTLNVDLSSSGSFDQINVSGDLKIDGDNFVKINPLDSIVAGSYPIVSYGSLSGAGNLIASGPVGDSRYGITFDTNAPNVTLNISGSNANLSWSGGNNNNVWDIKTTTNWNAGSEEFYTYDTVDFSDGGSATPAIDLVGTLLPLAVTVNGSQNYTFAGSGKISGKSSLALNTSSTLTVLTTNDFTGGTLINSGTLVLGNDSTAQGSLGSGPVTNFATLVFNPTGTQTNANVISGSGAVIKRGSGVTRLSGASTFTGDVTIEAGTLQTGSATALGDASINGGIATVQSGATLDVGSALGTKPIIASGAGVNGAGAIVNYGGSQFLRDVQLADDTTIGGTSGMTIASSSASSTDPGFTAYGYKLDKVGSNHLKIQCLRATPWNLQLGEVDVQSGLLSFYDNLNLGSETTKPITVRSNATVAFAQGAAFPLTKAIVLDDGSCVFGLGTASTLEGTMALNGASIFEIDNAKVLTINSAITGNGSLVKGIGFHPSFAVTTGTGNLVLSAVNTFTGDLLIKTGKVTLTNSASIDNAANIVLAGGTLDVSGTTSSTLTLAGSQSLTGSGSIIGALISPAGTVVAPGGSNGVLNVTGSVTLGGTTTLELSKTGTTLTNDQLNATGTLTLGGTLNVTFSADALAAGDKFTLFNAGARAGQFTTVNLPAIPNLVWTNKTAIDGTIEILPVSVPEIGSYGILPNGNFNLQFSGVNGAGYSVLTSTNIATPVNQWTVLTSGVFDSNPVQFQDIDATNHSQRFYLITTP